MKAKYPVRWLVAGLSLILIGPAQAAPAAPSLPAGSPVRMAPGGGDVPPCECSQAAGLPASGGFIYHCRCGVLQCVVAGSQGGDHQVFCADH